MRKLFKEEVDMTDGKILPGLLQFSFPILVTGVLQLLYNAADVAVVGRFAGSQSLAAVGSTGALINFLVNMFMGLSLGGSVAIARANGARDMEKVKDSVHTTIALALISGFIVMIVGLFASRPLLRWMGSPDDVIDLATLYMQIIFIGMPANMVYNYGAGILRAMGDTRRPLIYLTVSGLVNVILNLLFVIVFHMGVAGVAVATIISQVLSAVFIILYLVRIQSCIHLDLKKLNLKWDRVKEIIQIGLPAGIQGCLFSISNVVIQSSVNSQGSMVMAGNASASNLEGFVYTAMNAIAQATLTFTSTNYGARNTRRIKNVWWTSLGLVTVIGFAISMIVMFFGEPLLHLYNTEAEVTKWGMVRMHIILPLYFTCGLMDVAASQLRGVGYSVLPMLITLTGACLLRFVWVFTVFAANPTMTTLYISYPVSWILTFSVHFAVYMTLGRKKLKTLERI